jgi:hypothetical protein
MRFTTESKSIYEADLAKKKIRRVSGSNVATPSIGDNEWRSYANITSVSGVNNELIIGKPAIIFWVSDVLPLDPSEPNAMKTTITSNVLSIEEDPKVLN